MTSMGRFLPVTTGRKRPKADGGNRQQLAGFSQPYQIAQALAPVS